MGNGRVPLLTHLNADTSWLLQLPYPSSALAGRIYYNILIDPWLRGAQVDIASWFSRQSHTTQSRWASIAEVEEMIAEREEDVLRARSGGGLVGRQGQGQEGYDGRARRNRRTQQRGGSMIDAVVICHEFADHCHRDTLLEVGSDVPVFASKVGVCVCVGGDVSFLNERVMRLMLWCELAMLNLFGGFFFS